MSTRTAEMEALRCDVLVVGDGEAGRLAALAEEAAGADAVLLDERDAVPGTTVRRTFSRALVWGGWREAGLLIAAAVAGRRLHVRPGRLIIALRGVELAVPVPGWTLPGVMGIDTARAARIAPGRRVVVAGSGPELSEIAAELGAAVVEVFDEAAAPDREIVACLGPNRFAALSVREAGRERVIEGDVCILSGGRRPEIALARLLGAAVHRTEVRRGPDGRTSLPDVRVVGDGGRPAAPRRRTMADSVIVCPCETVTAGQVRAVGGSAVAAKRATRAGMGACGGRVCAPLVAEICGAADPAWDTPRPPVRLVPASAILRDIDDPHPPVWDAQVWEVPPIDRTAAAVETEIAVIGGGFVGLATALFLARAGCEVVVLDRGEPGQAASSANAGSLHVQLLPYTFSEADPGPLASILALGPESIALWQDLACEAGDDFGIRRRGGLVLARHADDMVLLKRKASFERSRGVTVEVIGPAEVARICPALAPVAGAAWCAAEGQIDPLRAVPGLLRLARQAGVRVLGGRAAQEIVRDGSRWHVATAAGPLLAAHVVNCAHAGAGAVARLAGVSLPVRTVVQQVIATARAAEQNLPLVAVAGRHLSLKQNHGGQLLVGGGWPGDLQPDGTARVVRASLEGNLALAASVLPMLAGVDVVRAWATPTVHLDRGPVLSATPGLPGLWHAVVSNGATLGPGVGRLMADAILGRAALPAAFGLAHPV